jgi:hypothetical protein
MEMRSAWPKAMERISRMPALVYKFLRQGNVGALAHHLRANGRHAYNLRPQKKAKTACM